MNKVLKFFAVLVAPLMLTGCFFLPGKFDATLKLMKGGAYEFSYVGEMQVFGGDDKDMKKPVLEPFEAKNAQCSDWIEKDGSKRPSTYYDRNASDAKVVEAVEAGADAASDGPPRRVNRDCTKEELKDLKQQEADRYERRKNEYDQRSGMMAAAFGGAVPGNDEALEKFAETLSKYDGWDKVEYAGDNIFNIEYRASGSFDRYFAFPIINDASTQFPFFQIVPRKSGELEFQAPAIGGQGGIMGMAMMGGLPGGRMTKDMPIKPVEGSLTIETDGEILGNNSPDGYKSEGGMKVMKWEMQALTESPRALIKIK